MLSDLIRSWVCVNFLFILPVNLQLQLQEGDFCILTNSGSSGKCVGIRDCPSAIDALKRRENPQTCIGGRNPIVCCADAADEKLGKADQKCRDYANEVANLNIFGIIGGSEAIIMEFPHMAALGFGNRNDVNWQCGGSLISEQWILTAAHCLFSRGLGEVEWVRLGDLDIDSGSESKRDYQVIKRIYHPEYKPPVIYNDIGLVLIEEPVTFTAYIKPACLFGRDMIGQYIDLIATGWGLTKFGGDAGNTLQKVYLDLFTEQECSNTYNTTSRKLPQGIKHNTQFCAGGRGLEKDTCQGDSGGPLQTFRYNFGLYGIVGISSFGKACGVANLPGVYTKVADYVPWIESIVWP